MSLHIIIAIYTPLYQILYIIILLTVTVGTSEANIFLPPHMYTNGVVESNMNAVAGGGEMYAEVDDMQKMKVEASLINSQ